MTDGTVRQGAALVRFLRPRPAVPAHNDDYGVFKSPLSAFLEEAASFLEEVASIGVVLAA